MTRLCREAISIFDRADSAPLTPPGSLNVAVRTLYYTYAYPISALLDSSIRIGHEARPFWMVFGRLRFPKLWPTLKSIISPPLRHCSVITPSHVSIHRPVPRNAASPLAAASEPLTLEFCPTKLRTL